jgi:hypothetical protein
MILLPRISLLAILGSATFSFAANVSKTILPDNVVICEPSAGCVSKTIFGRSYKVISTPRFTVMVSVSTEGGYTRADVSVSNNIPPKDLNLPIANPAPATVPPASAPNTGIQSPSPTHQSFVASDPEPPASPLSATSDATPQMTEAQMLYAAQEQKIAQQDAADRAAAEKHLSATSIPPNEVTRGRVYFERDKKSHLVNVVLPIAGVVFEFPYALKH